MTAKVGISIRFVQQFDAARDEQEALRRDCAMILASDSGQYDLRPFAERYADALEFVRRQNLRWE